MVIHISIHFCSHFEQRVNRKEFLRNSKEIRNRILNIPKSSNSEEFNFTFRKTVLTISKYFKYFSIIWFPIYSATNSLIKCLPCTVSASIAILSSIHEGLESFLVLSHIFHTQSQDLLYPDNINADRDE